MNEMLMWIGLGFVPLGVLAWCVLSNLKGTRNFAQEYTGEIIAFPPIVGLLMAAVGFIMTW